MIELKDKQTGRALARITDQQLQFLVEQLEEESANDTDYYLNAATLDMFAQNGADPALLNILRDALGEREDMEIQWVRA